MLSKLLFIIGKDYYTRFVILFFLMLIGTFVEMLSIGVIPVFVLSITDADLFVQKTNEFLSINLYDYIDAKSLVYYSGLIFFAAFVLKNLYLLFLTYYQGKLRMKLRETNKLKLFKVYLFLPYKFHLDLNPSLLTRNIISMTTAASDTFFHIINIFKEILVLIGVLILIYLNDISIYSILIILILGTACYLFYALTKKKVNEAGQKFKFFSGKELKDLSQAFFSIKETKISSKENFFHELEKKNVFGIELNKFRSSFISSMPRLFLEVITILILTLFLTIFVLKDSNLSLILPTLALVFASVLRLIPAFNTITSRFSDVVFSQAAVELVYKELKKNIHIQKEYNQANQIDHKDKLKLKNISIKDLNFSYENKKDAIKNFNMEILSNQKIGILGKSGSGKTTFIDLLIGLHKPSSGAILFNNINIHSKIKSWQNKIGYVPQNLYLFDDTILSNITFGEDEKKIDHEKFEKAVKIARIENFISGLEFKEKTIVGNNGIRISGGERQRIGIARALYKMPEILIFDESTSSLDSENEKIIMNEIDQLDYNCTKIIISHKLNPLVNCDQIYLFENGEIIEKGNIDKIKKKYFII